MEKICIAKRRRRELFPGPDGSGTEDLRRPAGGVCLPVGAEKADVISMELTAVQARLIQNRSLLSPGRTYMVTLEEAEAKQGLMVFNFRMAPFPGGRMLKSRDVCGMLKISMSCLARLIKAHEIESYRIGRLRRFLLEDILHYLGRIGEWTRGDRMQTGAPVKDASIQ
jgi:excisionase family DNA binding protein